MAPAADADDNGDVDVDQKLEVYLPGWKPSIAAQVPLLYQHLKSLTPEELDKQAPLPILS